MTKRIPLTRYERAVFKALMRYAQEHKDSKGLGVIMMPEGLLDVLTADLYPEEETFMQDHGNDYFPEVLADHLDTRNTTCL